MNPPNLPDERAPTSNRWSEAMTDMEPIPFVFRANWFQFCFSRFGMIQMAIINRGGFFPITSDL